MKRIVCFHLYNDYSGSPKVLSMVLKGLLEKGCRVDLVTSQHGGALDALERMLEVKVHRYRYTFSDCTVLTMVCYVWVQLLTFFWALRWLFVKDAVFYINTILPVGPAIAGKLMGKRVVYHYHENAFAKGTFYKILAAVMQWIADEIICVSAYQASFLKRKRYVKVVPNALPKDFVTKLKPDTDMAFERKTVLMLSSLKEYKGTRQFIELAEKMPQYKFVLVINDTQENIENYLRSHKITPTKKQNGNIVINNLTIYPRQEDVTFFYNAASIVLNLTDGRQAIETFGLTPLEAMTDGLPVIVPTVGGIAELVID